MWLACLVTTALLPTLLFVSPVMTFLCKKLLRRKRIHGDVESASVWLSWPGDLNVSIKSLTVKNPNGFQHENIATLGSLFCSVNVFSIFSKCVKIEKIQITQPRFWIERKDKLGLNLSVFLSQLKDKEVEEVSQEEENEHANLLLSVLGLVPETAEAFIGNVTQALNASDGIADLAFSTGQNIADKTKNVLELGFDFMKTKASEVQQDISSAGGVDKWAADGVKKLSSQVRATANEATTAASSGGIHGVTSYLSTGVSKTASSLTVQAEDAILYELLHRKVAGCYEEEERTKYVEVIQFEIVGMEVDADLMLDAKQQKVGKLVGTCIRLMSEDLVPHPDAQFDKGIPVAEFKRRVLIITNHEMRRENSSKIMKLAGSGLKQSIAIQGWMLPKAKQSAIDYIDGFATGLTGMVADAAQLSESKGSSTSLSSKAKDSKEVEKAQGKVEPDRKGADIVDSPGSKHPIGDEYGPSSTAGGEKSRDGQTASGSNLPQATTHETTREVADEQELGAMSLPNMKDTLAEDDSHSHPSDSKAQQNPSKLSEESNPEPEGVLQGTTADNSSGKDMDHESTVAKPAGDNQSQGDKEVQVDVTGEPQRAGTYSQASLTSANKDKSHQSKTPAEPSNLQLGDIPETIAKMSESALEDAGNTIRGAFEGFGQAFGALGFKGES